MNFQSLPNQFVGTILIEFLAIKYAAARFNLKGLNFLQHLNFVKVKNSTNTIEQLLYWFDMTDIFS